MLKRFEAVLMNTNMSQTSSSVRLNLLWKLKDLAESGTMAFSMVCPYTTILLAENSSQSLKTIR